MNLPEGWPTEEMIAEVEGLEYDFTPGGSETVTGCVGEEMAREIFTKMLAAAPTPPAQEDEPFAWMIEYEDSGSPVPVRKYFGHNAIGDYRDTKPNATSIPLYTRPAGDKLRQAANDLVTAYNEALPFLPHNFSELMENLDSALGTT